VSLEGTTGLEPAAFELPPAFGRPEFVRSATPAQVRHPLAHALYLLLP